MKRLIICFLLVISPFIFLVGYFALFVTPNNSRGLGRLGMIAFDDNYEVCVDGKAKDNIPFTMDCLSSEPRDSMVLVIGDSFSREFIPYNYYVAAQRKEPFYKHSDITQNPFQYAVSLLNIQKERVPKKLIIETVERAMITRLLTVDYSMDTLPPSEKIDKKTKPSNILLRAQEYYKKRLNIDNPVKHAKLSKDLFSCKGKESDLYFYQDDLAAWRNEHLLDSAVQELNRFVSYLESYGVTPVIVIAADKYEIYRPFIINNPYDESDWLDQFIEKANCPSLVNSADTLRKMAANGVLDLYYSDDTHWSPVGAKAVADYLVPILERKWD